MLCSPAIQGEGPLLISDLCANVSQVPGIRAVSTVAGKTRRAFTLYHRWIGNLIKEGEIGEGDKSYVNNISRWAKSSLRRSFKMK